MTWIGVVFRSYVSSAFGSMPAATLCFVLLDIIRLLFIRGAVMYVIVCSATFNIKQTNILKVLTLELRVFISLG